jgi:hypothetical protein
MLSLVLQRVRKRTFALNVKLASGPLQVDYIVSAAASCWFCLLILLGGKTTLTFENVCSWRIVSLVLHSLSNE